MKAKLPGNRLLLHEFMRHEQGILNGIARRKFSMWVSSYILKIAFTLPPYTRQIEENRFTCVITYVSQYSDFTLHSRRKCFVRKKNFCIVSSIGKVPPNAIKKRLNFDSVDIFSFDTTRCFLQCYKLFNAFVDCNTHFKLQNTKILVVGKFPQYDYDAHVRQQRNVNTWHSVGVLLPHKIMIIKCFTRTNASSCVEIVFLTASGFASQK